MIGVHIKDLAALRALPEMQDVQDSDGNTVHSPLRNLIDGIRTPIRYNHADPVQATESFAFVRDLVQLGVVIEQYPAIAETFTPEQISGYKRQVVVDEEPQWSVDSEGFRTPVLEDVAHDSAARTAYDACYDRTPYLDGEGNTVTPPFWFGRIAGYENPRLLEPLE